MDEESYANPTIAGLINRGFVAVKVDRDERPDIDRRYQAAVSAAFGVSGWPLTVLLTPSGAPIVGGTYFPPTDRDGRPGLTAILQVVSEAWREERAAVVARVAATVARPARPEPGGGRALGPAFRDTLRAAILGDYDFAHGGFPGPTSAQFPRPAALRFLLRRAVEQADGESREAVTRTLDAMARGGIRDHLGGGFHRYTVDRAWRVPHFEMLAATNAELLRVYLQGWQATGNPAYREVAEEIVRFARARLADPAGGFYASLDADGPDGVEGAPYTWTWDEVSRLLTSDQARAVRAYYGLAERPERVLDQPDRNVLAIVGSLDGTAKTLGRSRADARALLDAARATLGRARAKRPAPAVDRARYSDANAAMITAWLEASVALDQPATRAFALASLERLLREAYRPGRGVGHLPGPDEAGFLDDAVLTAESCLVAYQVTREPRYLAVAIELVETARRIYWDPASGGFLDRPPAEGEGLLEQPAHPVQDGGLAAGNGTSAQVLLALAAVTGERRYREWARETLAALAGQSEGLGSLGGALALALDLYVEPQAQVVVVGRGSDSRTLALWRRALAAFRPGKVVLLSDASRPPGPDVPEPVRAKLAASRAEAGPTAYVCAGTVCSVPLRDPAAAVKAIRTFGTRGMTEGIR